MRELKVSRDDARRAAAWAAGLPFPGRHVLPSQAGELIDRAVRSHPGFSSFVAGRSSAGRPIRALAWTPPQGASLSAVAYGYPHPDEPAGAGAIAGLIAGLAAGGMPECLAGAAWTLIPCADPDQAAVNEPWIADGSADAWLAGDWRPWADGLEVDYAFPIDWGLMLQPRSWAPDGHKRPLPESLALADAFERARPDFVAMLHANAVTGDYQFLSHRPSSALTAAFDEALSALGRPRHLGERPDAGRRWLAGRPDWMAERTLADRLRWLARNAGGPLEGRRWLGCVSAGMFLEAQNPECLVLTPEAGMFELPGCDDTSPAGEAVDVTVKTVRTRRGARDRTFTAVRFPDGSVRDVCVQSGPAGSGRPGRAALTAGMAGAIAVEVRRHWLGHLDRLFASARPDLRLDTPRLRERDAITVPHAYVNSRDMTTFRCAEPYRSEATVAQLADFRVRWAAENCAWIGHACQLYAEQGHARAHEEASRLFQLARAAAGPLPATAPADQARSQLARTVIALAGVAAGRR